MLPFIHLHVDEKNDIRLCCNSEKKIKPYSNDFDFVNDTDFVEIRNKLLQGQAIEHCSKCYNVEQGGAKSSRYYHSNEWITNLNIDNIEEVYTDLVFYDIRNDNTCNLACRMCYPGFSSQLEKEFIKLNWIKPSTRPRYKITEIINVEKIKKLYMAGGEPTLIEEFKEFLQLAIDKNRTDIELRIITNGTNVNKEFAELLSNFSNIEFTVSIDGYNQVNRYIRWPSNWLSLVDNIKRLYNITQRVSFNITVTMWNISQLSQLVKFLDNEFDCPIIFLNIDEGQWNPFNFPNKQLVLKDLEELKTTASYNDAQFKDKVDYFITKISTTVIDKEKLKKFFTFNDLLDQSRDVKLIDYIPELEECRSYLTKQMPNTNAE